MGAHLFVVNSDSFPIHIQNRFCGVVKGGGIGYYGQLADLMAIRKGDLVFFYLMYIDKKKVCWRNSYNKFPGGYYGIYRVTSKPFFDTKPIQGRDEFCDHIIFGDETRPEYEKLSENKKYLILPIRLLIEPIKNLNYKEVVNDDIAYVDKTDEGQLWTLLFKKAKKAGQARGITPLIPEEASKIARLLFKQNQIPLSDEINLMTNISSKPYPYLPISTSAYLTPEFESIKDDKKSVRIEDMLTSWIMANIDKAIPVLREVVGPLYDLEFFGSHVQYGISGDAVDILLLHKKRVTPTCEYRYKATVIELKRQKIRSEDVAQALRYTKWISQLVTYNNISAIQPVIIGKRPTSRGKSIENIKNIIAKLNEKGIRTPIFLEYFLENNTIRFEKFTL